jgi:hypothetical protein
MYLLNTLNLQTRRSLVVCNYQPPTRPPGKLPELRPDPGVDGNSQPSTTGNPIPGQGNSAFRTPRKAGSGSPSGSASNTPGSNPTPQTVSLPEDKKVKKKTKQMNKRKTKKAANPFMIGPDRPELLKYTGEDRAPVGELPYRDGPPVFTPDHPFGKIGELANAGQFLTDWDSPASKMNNIRTLVQIIQPR